MTTRPPKVGDSCPRKRTEVTQCKTCPWRVGTDPTKDIPNGYSVAKHRTLKDTIADGATFRPGAMRVMACHYSGEPGKEIPCAGWLSNQLGAGNNIGVRLAVMSGAMPVPNVDGPQHETFEATLPKTKRRAKARP